MTRPESSHETQDAGCRLFGLPAITGKLICKLLRIAEVSRDGAGLPYEDSMQYGFPYCGYKESRPAGSIGLRGGSYCRRPGSVSGWMVAAVCRRPLLTSRKCQLYPRSSLSGKTPSKTTGNVGDEPRVSMDDADKSSTPSIPGTGITACQASGYGKCFARSGRRNCKSI